jgi:hypothetical protein
MTTTVVLVETEWLVPLALRTDCEDRDFRHCDFCGESAFSDDGLSRGSPRRFFNELTDGIVTLTVCERCLDEYLNELP